MAERLTIKAAAARLGVSTDTIRRRIKAGTLTGERESTPQGHRWVVALPVTLEPPPAPESVPPGDVDNVHVTTGHAGADAVEVATLRERVAGLERLGAELATDRDAWRDQAARHEEAAQQLRTLVAQAQQMTRALPAGDGAPPDDRAAASTPAPVAPWWRRLWGGR